MKKRLLLLLLIIASMVSLGSCTKKNNTLYKGYSGDKETGRIYFQMRVNLDTNVNKDFVVTINYGRSENKVVEDNYVIYYLNNGVSEEIYSLPEAFKTSEEYIAKYEDEVFVGGQYTVFFGFKNDEIPLTLPKDKVFVGDSGSVYFILAPKGLEITEMKDFVGYPSFNFTYDIENETIVIDKSEKYRQ